MKYHVMRTEYGPGAKNGPILQEWDLEDIKQPHKAIFEHMQAQGFWVLQHGEFVYLIGVKV